MDQPQLVLESKWEYKKIEITGDAGGMCYAYRLIAKTRKGDAIFGKIENIIADEDYGESVAKDICYKHNNTL